jgi:hypothetical protein
VAWRPLRNRGGSTPAFRSLFRHGICGLRLIESDRTPETHDSGLEEPASTMVKRSAPILVNCNVNGML